mmetsp:Transcript_19062/g.48529  ORF Transcript_19062/g.48529 Transcript_19062/m.48529 type:complete len:226 (-) Transcript_19062:451-1128(-)
MAPLAALFSLKVTPVTETLEPAVASIAAPELAVSWMESLREAAVSPLKLLPSGVNSTPSPYLLSSSLRPPEADSPLFPPLPRKLPPTITIFESTTVIAPPPNPSNEHSSIVIEESPDNSVPVALLPTSPTKVTFVMRACAPLTRRGASRMKRVPFPSPRTTTSSTFASVSPLGKRKSPAAMRMVPPRGTPTNASTNPAAVFTLDTSGGGLGGGGLGGGEGGAGGG